MELWEIIEKRVNTINQSYQIQLSSRRDALCVNNVTDPDYAAKLKNCINCKSMDEIDTYFENEIAADKQKLYGFDLAGRKELYLLFVSDRTDDYAKKTAAIKKKLDESGIYNRVTMEGCIVIDKRIDDVKSETRKEFGLDNNATWIVEKNGRGIASIQSILQNATFSEKLLSAITIERIRARDGEDAICGSRIVLGIKTEECNAVREDLCKKLFNVVSYQLSPGEEEIGAKIRRVLFPETIQNMYFRRIPQVTWFPLLGYEYVKKELKNIVEEYPFYKRWFANEYKSKKSVGTVLFDLYQNDTDSGIEQIRTCCIAKASYRISEEIQGSQDFKQILSSLEKKFTLFDFIFEIRNSVQNIINECDREIYDFDEKFEKCLKKEFVFSSIDPSGMMKGLNEYCELFDQYARITAKREWWKQLAVLFSRISEKKQTEFEEMQRKKRILEKIMIGENYSFSFEQEVRTQIDPENLESIVTAFSREATYSKDDLTFNKDDLLFVLQEKNRGYEKKKSVELKRNPVMFMIVSGDADMNQTDADQAVTGTAWKLLKENYVPKWITYQIRVFNFNLSE